MRKHVLPVSINISNMLILLKKKNVVCIQAGNLQAPCITFILCLGLNFGLVLFIGGRAVVDSSSELRAEFRIAFESVTFESKKK